MEVGSNLLQEIQRGQLEDEKVQEIKCSRSKSGLIASDPTQ
jgi:hypothetical protein